MYHRLCSRATNAWHVTVVVFRHLANFRHIGTTATKVVRTLSPDSQHSNGVGLVPVGGVYTDLT